MYRILLAGGLAAIFCGLGSPVAAQALPQGYFVWSRGEESKPETRKIYRMTLPNKGDVKALTSGEDVEAQISPDGQWVAYAKAKLPGGSDYHNPALWKIYVVSIHGAEDGREEIKIDDTGSWPSWGSKDVLYYNQPDGAHTKIMRVELDDFRRVVKKEVFFATKTAFSAFREVNEGFVAPDGSWFAARTRGNSSVTGVGAYQVDPPEHFLLARAGTVGCMPYVAPSSQWGIIAGAEHGIRWGHAPSVPNRKTDQLLIPAKTGFKAYHPGISTDEHWVLASFGETQDHNSGAYNVSIYALDPQKMEVGEGTQLTEDGFNGWPHVWVGKPSAPPPPRPLIIEFYPSSFTITTGERVELTWATRQADTVILEHEAVATEGTKTVKPTSSASYTLRAESSRSTEVASDTLELTVNDSPQAATIERFEADSDAIEVGASTKLRWLVRNAMTLELDGRAVRPEGELEVSPQETTTYRLSVEGAKGPVSAQVTVTVTEIESGLLEDKGGFVCTLQREPAPPGIMVLLMVGLLLGARRPRRRGVSGARRPQRRKLGAGGKRQKTPVGPASFI